jgi:hypothetical protein
MTAFATFSQRRVGAAFVGVSTFYVRRMEQLAALAARHALPAIYPFRENALWPAALWQLIKSASIREGLITGHPDMLEFRVESSDVGAIIAYLKSIEES